jgi:hypothetical protein
MLHQTLEQRIDYIAHFVLGDQVPEDVRIHFETGKNLFVYAWYVYRFHTVAEQHILATLEMAARSRFEAQSQIPTPRGLSALLSGAGAAGWIVNDRFNARHRWATERAQRRHDYAEMERMDREGILESIVDYSGVLPDEEDLTYDWLGHFVATLPKVRNMHAHGSDDLKPAVGRTFEFVVELINQLFPDGSSVIEGQN